MYPTVGENFSISVADDALPSPGNKPLTQQITYLPGGGSGGGGRNPRSPQFTISGPSQYSEINADNVPFQMQVYISRSLKAAIGDLTQLISARNFRVTGGTIGAAWASTPWPAQYYDDLSTTFFFNVTAIKEGSVYPQRLQVELVSFPNATVDATRPPMASAFFTSQLPRVNVGIEAPSYYTLVNDTTGMPVPQPVYLNVHLDTPVGSPTQFTPSMMTLTGAVFTQNTTATEWSFVNNGVEFIAIVLPVAAEDGTFGTIRANVNFNSIGFVQGNQGSFSSIVYEAGASNAI